MTVQPVFPAIGPSGTRPKRDDPRVMKEAMEALYNDHVNDYLLSAGSYKDNANEVEQVVKELIKCYESDGYKFAKNLEKDFYWEADSELVDILDSAPYLVSKFHKKYVEQWYANNYFELYPIGTVVRSSGFRWKDENDIVYTIVKHYQSEARYVCARSEAELKNSCGRIIDHENLVVVK